FCSLTMTRLEPSGISSIQRGRLNFRFGKAGLRSISGSVSAAETEEAPTRTRNAPQKRFRVILPIVRKFIARNSSRELKERKTKSCAKDPGYGGYPIQRERHLEYAL